MSYNGQKDNQGKLNKYVYGLAAFVIVIILVFMVMHNGSDAKLSESAKQETKAEDVVVTVDPQIAEKKQKLLKDTTGDYFIGEKFAPVIVIEYASLSCPHCKALQEDVIDPMIANYVNKGKVKYIYRDFPHNEPAFPAAKLAHCADSNKYFSFIKVLFKSQEQWAYSQDYMATLKSIGKLGGVSEEKFDQCMKDKKLDEKILKTLKEAADVLNVNSVPAIFINGIQYQGKREYKDVSAFIDQQLKGE